MEIVIVLIILGVLAGIGIPSYQTSVERSRANEAAINLNMIYVAERAFLLDNNTYYPSTGAQGTLATINTSLGTDLENNFYTLNIAGGANTFTATATRGTNAGGDGASTITMNQLGCFGGTSPHVPTNTRPGC